VAWVSLGLGPSPGGAGITVNQVVSAIDVQIETEQIVIEFFTEPVTIEIVTDPILLEEG